MSKKYLTILTILMSLLISVAVLPTLAEEFTGNKCFDDWNWCNNGTEDEQAYWWEAGWCAAAIEAGVEGGTVEDCTSTPDDDYVEIVIEEDEDGKKTKKVKVDLGGGCVYGYSSSYFNFGTGVWISGSPTAYSDSTCQTFAGYISAANGVAYAPTGQTEADAICTDNGGYNPADNIGSDVWFC